MLRKLITQLIRPQPKKQFLAQKNYYSAKYLQPHQVYHPTYCQLFGALDTSDQCQYIANVMKDNLSSLTDYHISYAVYHIYNNDIELDSYFYNEIVPIIKEFVNNFDRECNKSLGELVKHLGWMEVNDQSLWDIFEKKLNEEKLWRYLPFDELINCTHALAFAGKGSDQLFEILEKQIIKQRLNLNTSMIAQVAEAFKMRGKGSNLLFKVLQNPKIDVKQEVEQKKLQ